MHIMQPPWITKALLLLCVFAGVRAHSIGISKKAALSILSVLLIPLLLPLLHHSTNGNSGPSGLRVSRSTVDHYIIEVEMERGGGGGRATRSMTDLLSSLSADL